VAARPAPKKGSAGCYIAAVIGVLVLFLGAGGIALAFLATRSDPDVVDDGPIAEPEVPEPPELPLDPLEEGVEPDGPIDLGDGEEVDLGDPELDPALREQALERILQRAFEQQEQREDRQPRMRLTEEERAERRRVARCVTRCMARAQRVCRGGNMDAECQATYLACITGCGTEADDAAE
jgi:hypothetical protein